MEHLTLFGLNKLIRETLDTQLDPSYWVIAEIGEMRTNQNGHCYLELLEKEDDRVIAKMRGTIWAYTYRNLSTWFEGITGQPLRPGLKVLCNVAVQFHELYSISVNIKDIDANYTLGERAQRRKKIVEQLIKDGVYDMNREHRLPIAPQRIAVISSPTAAGFGDFMDQLHNNSYGYTFHVKLFKALMQGEKACGSMINAMLQVHQGMQDYDALIIIRGGGSQIDLDCFDDYELASHIAQFPLPVITGIGHERDETIADMVAHTRMKTPTAVAEFLISGIRAFEEQLDDYYARIYHHTRNVLNLQNQKLSTLGYHLKAISREKMAQAEYKLNNCTDQLRRGYKDFIASQSRQLDLAEKSLQLLDPQAILRRGYSITTVNGKLLSKSEVKSGDELTTETADKIITSKVESHKDKK
ncbi:Exodeoxyribonuclease VII large subunit [Fulvivirga imtechensis AK7]|uniref:Exodeoxyribonuclease 7 large subunit n=1 Tax=Fulvivirga imtechensis AK7 TaxID=1237149 RepID=L8JRJ3_9BACT|nr:exodeoxyribonuclease VII large subunit [Fulvivirga imtechensis]ELR71485.1 Exodeoxyribonuclease VII large subunit [Fulvivirga imtechensis AK7]